MQAAAKINSWRGEGPTEGKRKSARVQDDHIPIQKSVIT
jgi:hypothetical protein